jgi:hypothetical protein
MDFLRTGAAGLSGRPATEAELQEVVYLSLERVHRCKFGTNQNWGWGSLLVVSPLGLDPCVVSSLSAASRDPR